QRPGHGEPLACRRRITSAAAASAAISATPITRPGLMPPPWSGLAAPAGSVAVPVPELPGAGAVPDGVPVGVAAPVTRAAPAVLEAPGVPRGGPGPVAGAAPEVAALPEAARLDRVGPEPPGGGDGGGA